MSELREPLPAGHLRDYIRIARPDDWVKNIFMVPGVAWPSGWSTERLMCRCLASPSLWQAAA